MKTIDNKQYNSCKAILLPTEDKTILIKDKGKLEVIDFPQVAKTINSIVEGFHFYITDDSEIKGGNWYLNTKTNAIGKASHNGEILRRKEDRKIIATTNPELIKDGVAKISEEFIKQWVNNPQEDVLIEVDKFHYEGEVLAESGGFKLEDKERDIFYVKTSPDNTVNLRFVEDDWNKFESEYDEWLSNTKDIDTSYESSM